MLWIGLTGGLGSGKSTAAKILRELGQVVIDADEMARLALELGSPALTKVVDHFGSEILQPSGEVDRNRLAARVFNHRAELEVLERLVHPEVKRLTRERRAQAEQAGHTLAFYDVPLLFEKNMESEFAKVIVVKASLDQQIERTMKRSKLARTEVEKRLSHQIPLAEKLAAADYVLDNSGGEVELRRQVALLLQELTKPKSNQSR